MGFKPEKLVFLSRDAQIAKNAFKPRVVANPGIAHEASHNGFYEKKVAFPIRNLSIPTDAAESGKLSQRNDSELFLYSHERRTSGLWLPSWVFMLT